jgi:aminoglycoside 3-N-acetyltransferase
VTGVQEVGPAEVSAALHDLGAGDGGAPVCLHSSLRAHGHVVGGAAAVVDAVLGTGSTLLVPTFDWRFAVTAPLHLRPTRNGTDDYRGWPDVGGRALRGRPMPSYDPGWNGTELGAVPTDVLARPGRVRGAHPLCSFTAVGPQATALVAGQTLDDVFAPLAAVARLGGRVVLAGVGLTRLTLLHLAEERAGRTMFRRWTTVDGEVVTAASGGCSEGFERFAELLAPIERRVRVGAALWRAFPAADVLEIAAAAIRRDPTITRCASPRCALCPDAVLGGPVI